MTYVIIVLLNFLSCIVFIIENIKTSNSKKKKNVYIDKLDYLVHEYNNTYHRTIKMKPIYVKDNRYINIGKEVNDKDLKFKVGDHVRISKYKIIFAKGYTHNWSEEVFVISKIQFLGHMLLMTLMAKKLLEHFTKIITRD